MVKYCFQYNFELLLTRDYKMYNDSGKTNISKLKPLKLAFYLKINKLLDTVVFIDVIGFPQANHFYELGATNPH